MKRNEGKRTEERSKPKALRIVSARADSTLVEMVTLGSEASFVVSDDRGIRQVPRYELDGQAFVPYSRTNTLLTHGVVLLPSGIEAPGDTLDLLECVQSFIHRHVVVSSGFEELSALYVLLSWRYDDFAELPYLRVRGDYGCGKSRYLQTVGSLTYKPMFASGASSTSPLFRLLDAIRGTLVLDESDFRLSDEKSDIIKILNNGNASGFPVLRTEQAPTGEFNPRAFHVFGPKIIATRRSFDDRALESRCITEDMGVRDLPRDVPLSLGASFHQEARELRNRLLGYRLREAGTPTAESQIDDASLEPRTRQLLGPLAAVAPEKANSRIQALGRDLSHEIRRERSWGLTGQLLTVLLALVRQDVYPISVGEVTRAFNARFERDLGYRLSARRVGSVMRRSVGVETAKRHGVFIIRPEDYRMIEKAATRYGVRVDVGDEGDVV